MASSCEASRATSSCLMCLVTTLAQDHGAEVVDGGVDLLEAVVASAQGEQDPRCLRLVFRAVRSLVRLLAAGPPQHAVRLEEVLSPT